MVCKNRMHRLNRVYESIPTGLTRPFYAVCHAAEVSRPRGPIPGLATATAICPCSTAAGAVVTIVEAFMHCGDGHTIVTGPGVSDLQ
jgi:hypothetical protein